MVKNGVSIIAVKEILGHADIKRYAHPDQSLIYAVESLTKDFSVDFSGRYDLL